MADKETLRALFDDKIIRILNTMFDNPSKNLSLTQVSTLSDVSTATTMRILAKLVKQDFAKITLIGKSKFYRLKKGPKTQELSKLIRRDDKITLFTDKIEPLPSLKKIVLVAKSKTEARIILVGDTIPVSKIKEITKDIKHKHNYNIKFVQLSEKQFSDMEKIGIEDLRDKVVWERT